MLILAELWHFEVKLTCKLFQFDLHSPVLRWIMTLVNWQVKQQLNSNLVLPNRTYNFLKNIFLYLRTKSCEYQQFIDKESKCVRCPEFKRTQLLIDWGEGSDRLILCMSPFLNGGASNVPSPATVVGWIVVGRPPFLDLFHFKDFDLAKSIGFELNCGIESAANAMHRWSIWWRKCSERGGGRLTNVPFV